MVTIKDKKYKFIIREQILSLFKEFLQSKGYKERESQLYMLQDVLDSILKINKYENLQSYQNAITGINAPTGTGKTYGYGFVILSLYFLSSFLKDEKNNDIISFNNNKSIISTATIALQEQLVFDLKSIQDFLKKKFNSNIDKVKIVKIYGKNNIVCPNISEIDIKSRKTIDEKNKAKLVSAVDISKKQNAELKITSFKDLNKDNKVATQFENIVSCCGIGKSTCRSIDAPCTYRNDYINLYALKQKIDGLYIFLINHSLHKSLYKQISSDVIVFDEADQYNTMFTSNNINFTHIHNQLSFLIQNLQETLANANIDNTIKQKILDYLEIEKMTEKMNNIALLIKKVRNIAEDKNWISQYIGGNITRKEKKQNKSGQKSVVINSNKELIPIITDVFGENSENIANKQINSIDMIKYIYNFLNISIKQENYDDLFATIKTINNDEQRQKIENIIEQWTLFLQNIDKHNKQIYYLYQNVLSGNLKKKNSDTNNNISFCPYFFIEKNNETSTSLPILTFHCPPIILYNRINFDGEGTIIATSATLSKVIFDNLFHQPAIKGYDLKNKFFNHYTSTDHNNEEIVIFAPNQTQKSIYETEKYDIFLNDICDIGLNSLINNKNNGNVVIVTYSLADKFKIEEKISNIIQQNNHYKNAKLLTTKDFSTYDIVTKLKSNDAFNNEKIKYIAVLSTDGSKGIDLSGNTCSVLISVRTSIPNPKEPIFYETINKYKNNAYIKYHKEAVASLTQTIGRIRGEGIVVLAMHYSPNKVKQLTKDIQEDAISKNLNFTNVTDKQNVLDIIDSYFDKQQSLTNTMNYDDFIDYNIT